MSSSLKIYVIHYNKLVERKTHMLKQLTSIGYDCEFVSNWGRDVLTSKDKCRFKNLNDSEISLTLHHFECFKRIAEGNDPYAMIFEDDVILTDDFREKLEEYIKELPENFDMFFIGQGQGVHIPKHRQIEGVHVYRKSVLLKNNLPGGIDGSTRCADSYIISKTCCKKIVDIVLSKNPPYGITMPLDHLLNYINYHNQFKIYWAEPTLVIQGTSNGRFKSSLRKNL